MDNGWLRTDDGGMGAELRVVASAPGGHRAVLSDCRGRNRVLRASWHHEAGLLVLSLWRDDACVGTARLSPQESARLAELIVAGLAEHLPPQELPPDQAAPASSA
jgi:hypothetical protein